MKVIEKLGISKEVQSKMIKAFSVGLPDSAVCAVVCLSYQRFKDYMAVAQEIEKINNVNTHYRRIDDQEITDNDLNRTILKHLKGDSNWGKDIYKFYFEVKKAKSQAIYDALMKIKKSNNKASWQANAWFLERACPNEFGRKELAKLANKQDEKVQAVNITFVDANAEKERLDKLEQEVKESVK